MTTESDSSQPPLPLEQKADEIELQEATQTELQQLKEAARFATPERALQVLEALFFAAEKPLDLVMLEEATQFGKELLLVALEELKKLYPPGGTRGVQLLDLGGRWQLRTEPQVGAYVRRMLQVKPMRLTRAALETLAIVAYRQPIARADVEAIRGVQCAEVLRQLMEKGLLRIAGRDDSLGRPVLYGTTKKFLQVMGLKGLSDLPRAAELRRPSGEPADEA